MSRKVLIIDDEYYQWKNDTITGTDLRNLGNVPDGAQIFLEADGEEDKKIEPDMTVSLVGGGIERFSTKSVGA